MQTLKSHDMARGVGQLQFSWLHPDWPRIKPTRTVKSSEACQGKLMHSGPRRWESFRKQDSKVEKKTWEIVSAEYRCFYSLLFFVFFMFSCVCPSWMTEKPQQSEYQFYTRSKRLFKGQSIIKYLPFYKGTSQYRRLPKTRAHTYHYWWSTTAKHPTTPLQTSCRVSYPRSSPVILSKLYFTVLVNPHKDKTSSCPIKRSSN